MQFECVKHAYRKLHIRNGAKQWIIYIHILSFFQREVFKTDSECCATKERFQNHMFIFEPGPRVINQPTLRLKSDTEITLKSDNANDDRLQWKKLSTVNIYRQ